MFCLPCAQSRYGYCMQHLKFPKPIRIKNRKLLDEVKKGSCLICGRFPVDPDHISTVGAGNHDTASNVWALCRRHHTEKGALGIITFASRYPQALQELESRGFTEIVEAAKEMLLK